MLLNHLLEEKPQKQNRTPSTINLERALTHIYKKIVSVLVQDLLLVVEVLPAVSTMIGTPKKTMQFGILVFLEPQEMNLCGNLQEANVIYCISLRELFLF